MSKLGKILKLSDPYPNFFYEIACYLKAFLGTLFFVFGLFLIFHPFLLEVNLFGVLETGLTPRGFAILAFLKKIIWPRGYFGFLIWGIALLLVGFFFFWRIKLVKKLFKILFK